MRRYLAKRYRGKNTYQAGKSMARKLVSGSGFEGYECDSCEWVWPAPRFITDGKTGEQMLRDDFDTHKCSEYPRVSTYDDFDS